MVMITPAAADTSYKVLLQSNINANPWDSGDNFAVVSEDGKCRLLKYTDSGIESVTSTTYRYAQLPTPEYAIVNYTEIISTSTGEVIVPKGQYDSYASVGEQYALGFKKVGDTREVYLIDLKNGGNATRLPDGAQRYGEGRVLVVDSNKKYYYTDKDGKTIMTLKDEVKGGTYRNGYAIATIIIDSYLSGYGIMDKTGTFTAYFSIPRFYMGHVAPDRYFLDAPESFVSAEGLVLIGEAKGDDDFHDNYGYANIQGKIVIPCEYTRSSHAFSYGYAVVEKEINKERQKGLIDTKGNVVIPFGTYENLTDVSRTGLIWAQDKNGRLCVLQVPVTGLSDTPYAEYYGEAVQWGMEKDIITSSLIGNKFSPNKESYILEAIMWLWRANGSPMPAKIPEIYKNTENYMFLVTQWATEHGLTWGSGTEDIAEGASGITRSQMMVYLWKLAGSPDTGVSNFTDVPNNAEYAKAVAWAIKEGITSGTSGNTFSPDTICTKGQVITFIHRALAK